MAQQRLRDYQSPLTSFLHNLINLGIHKPGRFAGFDTLIQAGVWNFSIAHTASGVNTRNSDDSPYGPIGVVMTNQGEVILEDTTLLGFVVDQNTTNSKPRQDLLVLNHAYFPINPSGPATYEIVKGPLESASKGIGLPPVLNTYQTLIGMIFLPAGANGIADCIYQKAVTPDSGDSIDAKLEYQNVFKKTNLNSATDISNLGVGQDGASVIDNGAFFYLLPDSGNTYKFLPLADSYVDGFQIAGGNTQEGTEINLVVNEHVILRSWNQQGGFANIWPAEITLGYFGLSFASRLQTGIEFPGTFFSPTLKVKGPNAAVVVSLVLINSNWMVKAIDGWGFTSGRTGNPGEVVEIHLKLADLPSYFDSAGGGLPGSWFNWQLTNGNRGTFDKRGLIGVMASSGPFNAGTPALNPNQNGALTVMSSGGSLTHTLTQPELPNVQLELESYRGGGEVYVHDTGSGGTNIGVKNDADNSSTTPGPIKTTPLGNGVAFSLIQPYVAVLYAMWIGG